MKLKHFSCAAVFLVVVLSAPHAFAQRGKASAAVSVLKWLGGFATDVAAGVAAEALSEKLRSGQSVTSSPGLQPALPPPMVINLGWIVPTPMFDGTVQPIQYTAVLVMRGAFGAIRLQTSGGVFDQDMVLTQGPLQNQVVFRGSNVRDAMTGMPVPLYPVHFQMTQVSPNDWLVEMCNMHMQCGPRVSILK